MSTIATISPEAVQALRARGPVSLVDVRTPAEYREAHIDGATLLPLDRFDATQVCCSGPVYVICEAGPRAVEAASRLKAAGREEVSVVDGGMKRWTDTGLPVVRGRKAVSLLRQVRILAGSLVLLGVGLGWFVHPAFYGLSAFIGAGLVFSGITDTCGMAWMLGRMPWNTSLK